jgi:hypothetical protein
MMSKRFGRRPEFETMENLVLLSGASVVGQQDAAALVAREPQMSKPILLDGRAEGSYKKDAGVNEPLRLTGTGNIHPVGLRTAIKGSVQLVAGGVTGSVTLTSVKGSIRTNLSASGPGSLVLYTITSGSGRFAHAAGQGVATFTTVPSRNPALGKFTITFGNPTS